MDAARLLPRLDTIYLLAPGARPRAFPRSPRATELPSALLEAVRALPTTTPLQAADRTLAAALASALGQRVALESPAGWREDLRSLPSVPGENERAWILGRARTDLEAALRAPGELLASLAREEERIERTVGREERAAEAFVAVPGTSLSAHAEAWQRTRALLAVEHAALRARLDTEARRVAPNLSALVGGRTAARLIAAAGGLPPLARMPGARLQLLGARRRPSAGRGPRHGLLYLADRAEEVPADRRGAFARSVAALAVIAARADAWTHADLSGRLVARRDARVRALRGGRR